MNNDNIQNTCTGECSLCETCIYDQVIPDDNEIIEKSDGKYCNGCPYVKYRYSTTNYLNWECTKATCEGIPKFIGFNVKWVVLWKHLIGVQEKTYRHAKSGRILNQ